MVEATTLTVAPTTFHPPLLYCELGRFGLASENGLGYPIVVDSPSNKSQSEILWLLRRKDTSLYNTKNVLMGLIRQTDQLPKGLSE